MPAVASGIGAGLFASSVAGGSLALGAATVYGGGFAVGATIGSFLAANAVPILLGVSALAIQAVQASNRSSVPVEVSTQNIRVAVGPRWHHLALEKEMGGQVILGEYDTDGNLWIVIYHSDSEL